MTDLTIEEIENEIEYLKRSIRVLEQGIEKLNPPEPKPWPQPGDKVWAWSMIDHRPIEYVHNEHSIDQTRVSLDEYSKTEDHCAAFHRHKLALALLRKWWPKDWSQFFAWYVTSFKLHSLSDGHHIREREDEFTAAGLSLDDLLFNASEES